MHAGVSSLPRSPSRARPRVAALTQKPLRAIIATPDAARCPSGCRDCAQACPTGAIVFGDVKDSESRVSKMKQQDRNYRLLDYLNIGARTSYLARIRNPNPKMPDAADIGVASLAEKPA